MRALVVGIVLGVSAISSGAAADETTKRACVRANEHGQDLRMSGKLLQARDRFTECSSTECPNVLREDCIKRRAEVTAAIPSLRVTVRDDRGTTITGASIEVDGLKAVGESIEVDPGEHSIRVVTSHHIEVVRRVLLQEGTIQHEELFVIPTTESAQTTRPSRVDPYRAAAYGIGGAGVVLLGVGTYFGLTAKATYDDAASLANCPRGPSSCNDDALVGASRADNQAALSTAMFMVGTVMLAGGIVVWLARPQRHGLSFGPRFDRNAAGVEARTSW